MIYEFATKVAVMLSSKRYIDSDEIDIVSYGLFSIASKVMYGAISLIMGMILDSFVESISFYVCFLFLKKYVGGFHAKTEFRCFVVSTSSIAISTLMIFLSKDYISVAIIAFCLSVIFGILISILAPAPSKERMLDENECKRYNSISRLRVLILLVISLTLFSFGFRSICMSISTAIVLAVILLMIGKISLKGFMAQNI